MFSENSFSFNTGVDRKYVICRFIKFFLFSQFPIFSMGVKRFVKKYYSKKILECFS